MRIIAGKYRAKKLSKIEGEIRPTSDRVKESLFEILSKRLQGARVLDLFCGSGALGIECLSRGAEEVVFNDISPKSLAVLEKNLKNIGEKREIYSLDFKKMLQKAEGKFDLIFADPPYRENYLPEICAIVKSRELLKADGLLIFEGERKEESFEGFSLKDFRSYGRTLVYFLEIQT